MYSLVKCEDAKKFKDAFEECQEKLTNTEGVADAELAAELEKLEVKEENEGGEEKVKPLSSVGYCTCVACNSRLVCLIQCSAV